MSETLTPGSVRPRLQPMGLGEILDSAIQMLRTNLLLFMAIAAVPGIANLGYGLSRNWLASHRGAKGAEISIGIAVILQLVFALAMLIVDAVARGAQCRAAAQIVTGETVTAQSAYARFRDRVGRMVGLGILQALYSFWPLILGAVAWAAAPNPVGIILFGVSLVCCGPFVARYALAYPATAVMDLSASESLRRSEELGRGFRWKVMWSYVLPLGVLLVVNLGGMELIAWLRPAWGNKIGVLFFWLATENLWSFAINLVFEPVVWIAVTLAYYDLCVRKEGLDIEQMMEQAGMPPVPAMYPTDMPAEPR